MVTLTPCETQPLTAASVSALVSPSSPQSSDGCQGVRRGGDDAIENLGCEGDENCDNPSDDNHRESRKMSLKTLEL